MSDQTGMLLRKAALGYARCGWHVIPLRPGAKRPAFPDHLAHACTLTDPRCRNVGEHVSWQERATTDPDRITAAWTRPTPAGWYGVGIACGPSGLLVVDLDTPKPDLSPDAWARLVERLHQVGVGWPATGADVLRALERRHGHQQPTTYTVTTPSGGTHLYFTATGGQLLGNTARSLGPLIDTRAAGGLVAAPPTTTPAGTYTITIDQPPAPAPLWLVAALTPISRPTEPTTPGGPVRLRDRYLDAAVRAEVTRITSAAQGERNHRLLLAAIALGQLVAGGALAEDDVRLTLTTAASVHVAAGAYTAHQAQLTIANGLTIGARRPRHPPGTAA